MKTVRFTKSQIVAISISKTAAKPLPKKERSQVNRRK